jgi:release factor glutamine methyltransferase
MIYDKLEMQSSEGVYEPAEDSYLLAEEVEKYAYGRVLDLGTGTGLQGIVAAVKGCDVVFADIDENALECARWNCTLNRVEGKFIRTDMFSGLAGMSFDTIIFNPPYLPGKTGKAGALALDGGPDGRRLIDKFLLSYDNFLSETGIALIVESSLNRYEKDIGPGREVISKMHVSFEDIVVIRLNRQR